MVKIIKKIILYYIKSEELEDRKNLLDMIRIWRFLITVNIIFHSQG